jgi:hypothetical protein
MIVITGDGYVYRKTIFYQHDVTHCVFDGSYGADGNALEFVYDPNLQFPIGSNCDEHSFVSRLTDLQCAVLQSVDVIHELGFKRTALTERDKFRE